MCDTCNKISASSVYLLIAGTLMSFIYFCVYEFIENKSLWPIFIVVGIMVFGTCMLCVHVACASKEDAEEERNIKL